jgi:hypothetical protein
MHRSGTSLTASVLNGLGVDTGPRTRAGDEHNPRGYHEDDDFLALDRRAAAAVCGGAGDVPGWPDWGWTTGPRDLGALEQFVPEATALVAGRAAAGRPWGWKDPRTTVLLDLWAPLVPSARYVCVYRPAWEVLDSIARVADEPFASHPEWVLDAWRFYNEQMLACVAAAPDRCVVCSAHAIVADPERAVAVLDERLHLGAGASARSDAAARVERSLFGRGDDPAIGALERLVALARPDLQPVFAALTAHSDEVGLSGPPPAVPAPMSADDAQTVLRAWQSSRAHARDATRRLALREEELARIWEESQARHEVILDLEARLRSIFGEER